MNCHGGGDGQGNGRIQPGRRCGLWEKSAGDGQGGHQRDLSCSWEGSSCPHRSTARATMNTAGLKIKERILDHCQTKNGFSQKNKCISPLMINWGGGDFKN